MKKQSTISSSSMEELTANEIEVLEALVELPRLILESESRNRFPFTWGCKRRRSVLDATPSPLRPPLSSSPTVPLLLHQPSHGGAAVAPSCKPESQPVVKAEASSPATPLSFSPSESDEKPRRKASLKRKKEDYLRIIEALTKDNNSLHGEIKSVERYRNQLKDFNLKLKARKQELIPGPKREKENPSLEIGFQLQIVHASTSLHPSNSMAARNQSGHHPLQLQFASTAHYVPLIVNQTVQAPQISGSESFPQFQYASSSSGQATTSLAVPPSPRALGMGNSNMGPMGIPDLNVSLVDEPMALECCESSDTSMANKNLIRAMAAQARQKRLQIKRVKNPIGVSKMRHSCR